MSILNNYEFAKLIDQFKRDEVDHLQYEVDKATTILNDENFKWSSKEQKEAAQMRFKKMEQRLFVLNRFYKEGMNLIMQHEALTNTLSKWYDTWYENVSNNGVQETELMESQADILQGIFVELYMILKPLDVGTKQPKALNLK